MAPHTMDMMTTRRDALDAMADLPPAFAGPGPFAAGEVDLGRYLTGDDPPGVPVRLVEAVVDGLLRGGPETPGGPGAVVVSGLSRRFALTEARRFHEELFRAVWDLVRRRHPVHAFGPEFRVKTNTTSDGAIPFELYGSHWSFKDLHMDRDALVFSHLYGPAAGFTGGSLLLADVRAYLCRHGLRFDDLFGWSEEPTPGSKPVLRAEHHDAVLAECGVDLGPLGPDAVLFVNNLPDAGVLHGVTPVVVRDRDSFVREFHRCSVKGVRP